MKTLVEQVAKVGQSLENGILFARWKRLAAACLVVAGGGLPFAAAAAPSVSATVSGAGGTVSVSSASPAVGERVRVTATPAAGYGFGKWAGDALPSEHAGDHALAFVARDTNYVFTATFLPAVYVKPDGDDAATGADWDNALATIPAALAKATSDAGVYVYLADGVYELTNQIVVATGSTLAGANPGAKAILKMMKGPYASVDSSDKGQTDAVVQLAHADARLYNIAITTDYDKNDATVNAYGIARNLASGFTRGVWIEKNGLVDSCVITNCQSRYAHNYGGGGVVMNGGGIVRNTLFRNNSTYSSGGNDARGHHVSLFSGGLVETCRMLWGGSGYIPSSTASVYLNGGTVRNSLIAYGTTGHSGAYNPTGVLIANGGTLENCTVAKNFHDGSSYSTGFFSLFGYGAVKNCIVWDNTNQSGVSNLSIRPGWGTPKIVNTCILPLADGTGNVSADPMFADAAAEDFRLVYYSPSVDAAVAADWMDWTTDLAGNARVQGDAPDMGCYELAAAPLACGFSAEGAIGAVTLKALVKGDDLAGLAYTWTLTDANGVATTKETTDATTEVELPAGTYDVALTVANGAGATARATRTDYVAVTAKDVYVSTTGTEVFPYASYETGAKTLEAALEAAGDGTVVHVAAGWYRPSNGLVVNKAMTIVAEEGPEKTVLFSKVTTANRAMVTITSAGATLSGFTISGRDEDGQWVTLYGGIQMTGGVVTNCWVVNQATVNITVHGAGCRLEGGTLVDCVFSNNFTRCSGGAGMKGGAVYQTGANTLVDRCLIVSNRVAEGTAASNRTRGGGVYLSAGVLRNSLVVGNFAQDYGGGVAVEGSGKVCNCTVVGNTTGRSYGGLYVGGTGASVVNTIAYGNTVNGEASEAGGVDGWADCLTTSLCDGTDPKLRGRGERAYAPLATSPCVNAGTLLDWMTETSLDVYGQPRLNGRPDIGAAECSSSGFLLIVR